MAKAVTKSSRSKNVVFKPVELQIINLLYKQNTNIEIAAQLKKNIRTVEGYRKKILLKTKSRNAVGIVLYALRKGMCKL